MPSITNQQTNFSVLLGDNIGRLVWENPEDYWGSISPINSVICSHHCHLLPGSGAPQGSETMSCAMKNEARSDTRFLLMRDMKALSELGATVGESV